MFGSPQDGVTKELLRFKLEGMNIALTDAELDQVKAMLLPTCTARGVAAADCGLCLLAVV